MSILSKFKDMTVLGKFISAVVVFGLIYGVKWTITDSGLFPKAVKESKIFAITDMPPLMYDKNANAPLAELPSENLASIPGPEIRCELMGWNAQTGLMYANGGVTTTENSFMAKQNLKVRLLCQNNCNKQAEDLFAFAQDYAAGNRNSAKGCQFIAWMGDGVPSYIAGLNEQIKKSLGEEYIAQVVFAAGSSFGEDKFLGKSEWKGNPQFARGSIIVGVLRDGDWNIAMKWASDNGIPVNNDYTTYDPDAINWMGTDDYVKAAQIYVSQTPEKRPIIRNGKRVGRDTTVMPSGVVTWTPGDVVAVQQRGGLVTIASTKDYSAQMPCTFIGIKKWMQDNRKSVESFILATCLGGDQVKSHSTALTFATKVSAAVYNDASMKAEDWEKYYKGFQYTDAQGNMIELGGSRVFNLADNAEYFGLNGGANKYDAVYKTFGDLCVLSYPEVIPSYPPVNEVVDLSYLTAVYTNNKNNSQMTAASLPTFKEGSTMSQLVSNKSITVEFDFGSANIKGSSLPALDRLNNDLIVAENLLVSIEGYTDNVGSPEQNLRLSQARADAIKNWLMNKDSKNFKNKISSVGYGEERPIADNTTDKGRQKNRRVEIKLGR